MQGIQEIEVKRLHQHPKNLRDSYEGIEELAESIRAQGVLQNLTVIPDDALEGDYMVVIGNRRLAAARAAGLETLPCKVVELTEQEVAVLMLAENRQRNDLTVAEEARGVQMCLSDFGMSVEALSKETGLSKDFIRARKKIADLPVKEVPKQATVTELLAVADLKDQKHVEDALSKVGTNNFSYTVEHYRSAERWEVEREKIVEKLEDTPFLADRLEQPLRYGEYEKYWHVTAAEKIDGIGDEVGDAPARLFAYFASDYNSVNLYLLKPEGEEDEDEEESDWEREQRELDEEKEAAAAVEKTAYQARAAFVTKALREHLGIVDCVKWLGRALWERMDVDDEEYAMQGGIDMEEDEVDWAAAERIIDKAAKDGGDSPKFRHEIEILVYSALERGSVGSFDYRMERREPGRRQRMLVEFMDALGYQWSDPERTLIDGTHSLYRVEEEEEEDG